VDDRFMAEALDLARRIPGRTWPNPPVGAVVVQDGEVVGRGAHHGAGLPHAEWLALRMAGEQARGATLYLTLEPCNHHGRTPPCTDAILRAGVARVVIGVRDPNPHVKGAGMDRLLGEGVEVSLGISAADCLELIWPFVATDGFVRPYVELKTAVSLDGRFGPHRRPPAAAPGPTYLTGEEARREVHVRRRWLDLVLVGRGTAAADRPRLDTRLAPLDAACPSAEPLAGYVDTRLALAAGLRRERGVVFCAQDAPGDPPAGFEALRCPAGAEGIHPAALLEAASARQVCAVLLEGGPRLAASFLTAGLVDRWTQYTAPVVLGDGVTWPAGFDIAGGGFSLTRSEPVGDDLRATWDRLDFAATLRRLSRPARQTAVACGGQ
jgi:diaminohydroxyphosphoribosylaminopyrimidine deaminase / 5-amino-6-(5-phosphoribosylamino)uracil reductase